MIFPPQFPSPQILYARVYYILHSESRHKPKVITHYFKKSILLRTWTTEYSATAIVGLLLEPRGQNVIQGDGSTHASIAR